jgi:hypothetical protein
MRLSESRGVVPMAAGAFVLIGVRRPDRRNFDQIRNDFFATAQWFSIFIRR